MIDLRRPNITGKTAEEKLSQIHSYLYQFVEQLEWAFGNLSENSTVSTSESEKVASAKDVDINPAKTFNAIKSLIIRSADIVDAYYKEMDGRFAGEYVSEREFGTYSEFNDRAVQRNGAEISRMVEEISKTASDLEEISEMLSAAGTYIRSGVLEYDRSGFPVYGIEIGQRDVFDGVETFSKHARFSADRISFYGKNDTEIAYISDYKLNVIDAEIKGALTLGGYEIDTSDGLVFRWKGGN